MHSLSRLLEQSQTSGVAIGHFNVSDLVLLKSVVSSALELQVPVMVGVSEGVDARQQANVGGIRGPARLDVQTTDRERASLQSCSPHRLS